MARGMQFMLIDDCSTLEQHIVTAEMPVVNHGCGSLIFVNVISYVLLQAFI